VGQDTALTPVTRHLSRSKVLMFLLDPTQDPRFRARCKAVSQDPQIVEPMQTVRQETILSEAAIRFRKHASLSAYQKAGRPLLVLVAKSDIWSSLIAGEDLTAEPVIRARPSDADGHLALLDLDRIDRISAKVRELLLHVTPEVVSTAEDFAEEVVYLPVSALGHSPEKYPDKNGLLIRPRDIHPHWVTVPLLYSYARWATGLIAGAGKNRRTA
jgi:hypothetical protein